MSAVHTLLRIKHALTSTRNVRFATDVHLVSSEISTIRTFMDTLGRTTLTVTALNLIDEARMKAIIVSTSIIRPTLHIPSDR